MPHAAVRASPRGWAVRWTGLVLLPATLIADLWTPSGYVAWAPYLVAVAAAAAWGSRRAVLATAAVSALFTVVAFFAGPAGDAPAAVPNRIAGVVLIALAAAVALGAAARREALARRARDSEEDRAWMEALRGMEERQRLLVDAAPNAMLMVDEQGEIVLVNPEAERLFGYEAADLVGRSVETLVPDAARAHHPAQRAGFLRNPRRRSMGTGNTLTARRRDGSEVPVEIGLNPIRTSDGLLVLAAVVDVSERLRREELVRSLEQKDAMLKEIHHRVRNNLQVVSSLLSLQSRQVEDAATRAALAESESRIRTISLVHERLYRSGNLSWIDLSSYLRELVDILARSYGGAEGKVRTEVSVEPVRADLDRAVPIGLIISELVTNAFKHAFRDREGGVIAVSGGLADGDLVLEVRDDGVGMAPRPEGARGRSLGLRLVDLLAGQLGARVERLEGPGTAFRIVATGQPGEKEDA